MKLQIKAETMEALRLCSDTGFSTATSVRLANGDWQIEVEDDTYERLKKVRGMGPTFDDVLLRMAQFYLTGGRVQ
jgi:hypothetical protein